MVKKADQCLPGNGVGTDWKRTFWNHGNVPPHGCGGSHMGVYTCQNLSHMHLKCVPFIVYKYTSVNSSFENILSSSFTEWLRPAYFSS